MRHVTHSWGIYWKAARSVLATPKLAAQTRVLWVLWFNNRRVIITPNTKNAAFATVIETATRNVGGLYSECNISDGLGIWWGCSWRCSCSSRAGRGVGKYNKKRMMTMENMSHWSATWIIPNDCTKHVHFVCYQHLHLGYLYGKSTTCKDILLHD